MDTAGAVQSLSEKPSLTTDVLGGALAALFTIPAAMAFGALVVAPLGPEALVDGVVMGLTGAAVAGLVAALTGARMLGITATGGQLAVLLASAVAASMAITTEVPVSPVLVVGVAGVMAGLVQVACGVLRLGRLVSYLPYPVVAGCGTGAAAVIILSQVPALLGHGVGASLATLLTGWDTGALAAGSAAIIGSLAARRWLPHIPEVVPGLIAGYVAHAIMAQFGSAGPTVGMVPTVVPQFFALREVWSVDMHTFGQVMVTVAPIAIAAGVLGSIVSLVSGAIIEGQTAQRRDGNRELLTQGIANLVAGMNGGLPGSLSESRSLLAWRSGSRTRVAAIAHALVILIAGLLLAPVIGTLPIAVLAAMLVLATIRALDTWTVDLIRLAATKRGKRTSGDLAVNLAVVIGVASLTVIFGLFWGLLVGLGVAVVQFIATMSRSVVRRRYRADVIRSKKVRSDESMLLLGEHGVQIMVFELQGALFFGTADQLAREVEQVADEARWVILDLRRVTSIDSSGARIIQRLHARLRGHGAEIALAHMVEGGPGWNVFTGLGVVDSLGRNHLFSDADAALEWAEESLLRARQAIRGESGRRLAALDIARGLSNEQLSELNQALEERQLAAGATVFEEGAPGDELFILLDGEVSVRITLDDGRHMRLSTFTPGVVFGEMALLDGSPRSASVIADEDSECLVLTMAAYQQLSADHPEIALTLTRNLGRLLADRLRRANAHIRALEQ